MNPYFQSLELLVDTITGCWDQEGDARLTSSCVLNRLKQMGGSNGGVVFTPAQHKSPLSSHAVTPPLEHYSVEVVDDDYQDHQQQQQQQLCQGVKTIVEDDFNNDHQQVLLQQQQGGFQELYQDAKAPLITNTENT